MIIVENPVSFMLMARNVIFREMDETIFCEDRFSIFDVILKKNNNALYFNLFRTSKKHISKYICSILMHTNI